MTRQESFKRRIRARMIETGEKYGASRRVLIEQADRRHGRDWTVDPGKSDASVREATGHGWEAWCDLLDAWPGDPHDHTALAAHIQHDHGIDGWWAQTVTVGYERITGIRLPFQRSDGTFSAGKTRTLTTDPDALRRVLLEDTDRADLFPGIETELRSRPTSKNVRLGVGPGVAEIALATRDDGRVTVTVQHERLPSPDDVERWKGYWSDWLVALDEG